VFCIGYFRNGQNDNLDTGKLVDDFIQFMNAYEEYFEDLRNHLEENEAYKRENLRTSIFNIMVVFLMENEKRGDDYLKDPEILKFIYNFYKRDEYYERYSAHGTFMNPFEMYLAEKAED